MTLSIILGILTIILWFIVGIVTIRPEHDITKLEYFLCWFMLMMNLFTYYGEKMYQYLLINE